MRNHSGFHKIFRKTTSQLFKTDQIVVSWLVPAEGWWLERTNVLTGAAGPWAAVAPPYQANAGVISVNFTNAPPGGNWFFRLKKSGP